MLMSCTGPSIKDFEHAYYMGGPYTKMGYQKVHVHPVPHALLQYRYLLMFWQFIANWPFLVNEPVLRQLKGILVQAVYRESGVLSDTAAAIWFQRLHLSKDCTVILATHTYAPFLLRRTILATSTPVSTKYDIKMNGQHKKDSL